MGILQGKGKGGFRIRLGLDCGRRSRGMKAVAAVGTLWSCDRCRNGTEVIGVRSG